MINKDNHIASIFTLVKSLNIWLFLSVFMLTACVEPIEFDNQGSDIIVVDGKVSTELEASRIILYGLNNQGVRIPLSNYSVNVTSSDGTSYPFLETETLGEYRPATNFSGVIGEQYQLNATSESGSTIMSSLETIQEPLPFELTILDTTRIVALEPGIFVPKEGKAAVATVDASTNDDYYSRFTFRYEYFQPLTELTEMEQEIDAFELVECVDIEACANTPQSVTVGVVDARIWRFFNPDCRPIPPECTLPCCIEFRDYQTEFIVKQESYSASSNTFWQQVELLLSNDGLVFDTYPFPITGNVTCDDCNVEVIGFFSAVGVNEQSELVIL